MINNANSDVVFASMERLYLYSNFIILVYYMWLFSVSYPYFFLSLPLFYFLPNNTRQNGC